MISIDSPRTAHCPQSTAAADPVWEREAFIHHSWDPGRKVIAAIRSHQRANRSGGLIARLVAAAAVLRHRFWCAIAGCDVPLNCQLGGGLMLPHPNGVVVHPDAEVGPNCILFQQVTLGSGGRLPGAPKLEAGVDVGAGAKILGGIVIGAGAKIGANAVVLDDVPAGATAVGMPARALFPTGFEVNTTSKR